MSLTTRIMIGMVSGVLLGLFLQLILGDKKDILIPLGLFDLAIKGFFCRRTIPHRWANLHRQLKNAGCALSFYFFSLWYL
jgi:hypothetical protein